MNPELIIEIAHNIIFTACIFLWLLILPAWFNVGFSTANATEMPENALTTAMIDSPASSHKTISKNNKSSSAVKPNTDASKIPAPFYPDPLLKNLGIDPSDIIKNQLKFKNNRIHIEWMDHIHEALPGICLEKEKTIIKTHTSLLFIKDRLDKNYFSGKINKQEYTTQLAEVMKWFQKANQSVLSCKEYNTLFGISGQENEPVPDYASDGALGFPIKNPETTIEMIKQTFDDATIRDITRFYRQQSQELRDIKEIYESKDFHGVTAEQVKTDMLRIEKELKAAFMRYCHDILSDEQFKLLFGRQTNN